MEREREKERENRLAKPRVSYVDVETATVVLAVLAVV